VWTQRQLQNVKIKLNATAVLQRVQVATSKSYYRMKTGRLLCCCAVLPGRNPPTFQRRMLPPTSDDFCNFSKLRPH
jgi:hypothetical protein